MAVIAGITAGPLAAWERNFSFARDISETESAIRKARVMTRASEGDSQYGVRLDSDGFRFFRGSEWSDSGELKSYQFTGGVTLKLNTTEGEAEAQGEEIVFQRLTATVDENYQLLFILNDSEQTSELTVSRWGIVEN